MDFNLEDIINPLHETNARAFMEEVKERLTSNFSSLRVIFVANETEAYLRQLDAWLNRLRDDLKRPIDSYNPMDRRLDAIITANDAIKTWEERSASETLVSVGLGYHKNRPEQMEIIDDAVNYIKGLACLRGGDIQEELDVWPVSDITEGEYYHNILFSFKASQDDTVD